MRKEHVGETKMLRKLFEQSKMRLGPCCKTGSSTDLQSRFSEARKAATQAVKLTQKRYCKEFGCWLDSNYSSVNKVFWQTICLLHGKSLSTKTKSLNTTRIQLSTSSRLRRKSFHVGENTLRTTPDDTCDTIDFGKEKIFQLTELAAAIRVLKSGKAAGKDEIRPEI